MNRRWAMAAAAALALLGARAASAVEPAATAPVLPAIEASETATCEEASPAELFTQEPKCADYGFFEHDKKADCEKSCKKGRKCQKKERCGDTGCPEPGYCWKCG